MGSAFFIQLWVSFPAQVEEKYLCKQTGFVERKTILMVKCTWSTGNDATTTTQVINETDYNMKLIIIQIEIDT